MSLKDLLWPHEYATPLGWLRYHTHRCAAGNHCWRRAVVDEPYVVLRACERHRNATINRVFAVMRETHKRRKTTDPLYRLETEVHLDELREQLVIPPHSIWWRMSHRGSRP